MTYDLPCISYMALYIISVHVININPRSSTHWRLNLEAGKVVTDNFLTPGAKINPSDENELIDDRIFDILSTTVTLNGRWVKEGNVEMCNSCRPTTNSPMANGDQMDGTDNRGRQSSKMDHQTRQRTDKMGSHLAGEILDCGEQANFTFYDHLVGIASRHGHPNVPEPELAVLFRKKNSRRGFDVDHWEKKLIKLKRENPNSVQVLNKISNFWRIKGHTRRAIECLRNALAFAPNDAEALLNLARVLYNLQYLDDAIILARRSLEMQLIDRDAWVQHYTLGEILKAYGHYHEASLHFRHALNLNPNFQPALVQLNDMELAPESSVHVYTLFIIFFLVLGVLFGILSSFDSNLVEEYPDLKMQRHFNRAMAMRSIKMGLNPRSLRFRKSHS